MVSAADLFSSLDGDVFRKSAGRRYERLSERKRETEVQVAMTIYGLTRVLIPPALGNLVEPELSQASTSAAAPRPSLNITEVSMAAAYYSNAVLLT